MRKMIVVGVDGSEDSIRAVEWAVEEAQLRGAELLAVHAWTVPVVGGPWATALPPLNIDFEMEATAVLDRALKEAMGGDDTVPVTRKIVLGSAGAALIEASRDAEMLVVGSRGLGGFRELLLGSVGHQCAHHAICPVVIVPHDEQMAAKGGERD